MIVEDIVMKWIIEINNLKIVVIWKFKNFIMLKIIIKSFFVFKICLIKIVVSVKIIIVI